MLANYETSCPNTITCVCFADLEYLSTKFRILTICEESTKPEVFHETGYNFIFNIYKRKATIKEAQLVCDIVQDTKAQIYPHYYTQAVVDFFGRLHSIDNIKKDNYTPCIVIDENLDKVINKY